MLLARVFWRAAQRLHLMSLVVTVIRYVHMPLAGTWPAFRVRSQAPFSQSLHMKKKCFCRAAGGETVDSKPGRQNGVKLRRCSTGEEEGSSVQRQSGARLLLKSRERSFQAWPYP